MRSRRESRRPQKLDGCTVYRLDARPSAKPALMNAPVLPEVLLGPQRADQPALPLASEGVQRYLWESRFGPILIEVTQDGMFVNGDRVEPCAPLPMVGDRHAA